MAAAERANCQTILAREIYGKGGEFPGQRSSSIVLVIAAAVLLVPIAQRLGRRTWAVWDKVCIYMACIATAVLLCGEIPFLFHMTTIDLPFLPLAFALIFSIFCGALGLWMGISKLLGRIVFGLFGVSAPTSRARWISLACVFVHDPLDRQHILAYWNYGRIVYLWWIHLEHQLCLTTQILS